MLCANCNNKLRACLGDVCGICAEWYCDHCKTHVTGLDKTELYNEIEGYLKGEISD